MSHGGGDERWLITYADMITLLMVFFIVMFASSQTQQAKLMALSDSLKKALHMSAAAGASGTGASLMAAPRTGDRTTAVTESIKAAAKALGIDKGVTVAADERGVMISLVDTFFFDQGGATIKPHARPLLTSIAEFIAATDSTIYVEGHTDDLPVRNAHGVLSSNWVLSSLRACEVVEFFLRNQQIRKERLVAVGYGDTRPLIDNDTAEHRARNRRVDIVMVHNDPRPKETRKKQAVDVLSGESSLKDVEKRPSTARESSGGIREGSH